MNRIIFIQNGGMGETPVPEDALLELGATLTIHDENDGSKKAAKVLAIVPVGTPIEVAIADQSRKPRPLMVTKPQHRETIYVLDLDGAEIRVKHSKIKRGLDVAEAAGLNRAADG